MKRSIKTRFMILFVGLMLLVLAVMWTVNNFFLESFYTGRKVKVLEQAYNTLNEYVVGKGEAGESISDDFDGLYTDEDDQTDISILVRRMMEKYNMTLVLVDSTTDQLIIPYFRNGRFLKDRLYRYLLGLSDPETEVLVRRENFKIEKCLDQVSKSYYLQNWGFFEDNRTMFIMSMPMDSIRDSVSLSSMFLGYVGVAMMLLGSILTYIVTRKVTAPIRELSALSSRMSELDFEARYTGDSQDELGILGRNMNSLSEKLKQTIGELKTANNELQNDIQEKIRIDEARKEFIANVSHELKTPIALIQGYAEGLTEGMAEDAESRDYYCEVIMDEAGKMNRMVKQLLTLTALEFGNDQPVMERFDLVNLIQGVLSSASILLEQKEARVVFSQEEPVYVWADEFKIEEVITNYLNNAMNHLAGERRIEIHLEQGEKEVRVTVFNTGEHIPEEDLPRLWTKFFKVDKARTREYGGSGIGLSIVKAIMESHNKECGAENVKDGVAFWFTLDCQV